MISIRKVSTTSSIAYHLTIGVRKGIAIVIHTNNPIIIINLTTIHDFTRKHFYIVRNN